MYLVFNYQLGVDMSEENQVPAALAGIEVGEELKGLLFRRVDVPGAAEDVLVVVEKALKNLAKSTDNSIDDALVDLVMPLLKNEVGRLVREAWQKLQA